MHKFITYLTIYILSTLATFAQIKSEEVLLKNKNIELPGTLTYFQEKTPLIIWIHGSGGINRKGNTPNYIQQFREAVNKEQIAFFSFDKRTSNPKNIPFIKSEITFSHFIDDVQIVINHFKDDKRFSSIVLIGHSQGSLIGMKTLENVDKYISLSGAGETIDKTLIRQLSTQNPLIKKPLEDGFKELKETGTVKEVNPMLASLFSNPNKDFIYSWMVIDPTEEIKKVTIPTLIINGDKDLQVLITDAEALKKAKPDAKYVIIKNMNHVLKDIQKDEDNMKSYYSAAYPLSKELIKVIVAFIKE